MEANDQLVDVNSLYALIQKDPFILESIDKKPFADTPLHAAAKEGNAEFVIEITRLMPSFTRKLNPDGFSPMHLAMQNGKTQTVLQLLHIDPDLVRVKGRGGVTPFHYASEIGDIYLLPRFLSFCPKSLEDVTDEGDTALHIALENDKLEAFQVLLKRPMWVGREEAQYCNKRILNWRNRDGNTPLHIATSKNQLEVVRSLLNRKVDVNLRNLDGSTPLDVLLPDQTQSRNEEIEDMLRSAGALTASSLPICATDQHLLRTDQRLNEAARVGDVDALYELISEDVHLLERIDQVPFIDTPLHIAASVGHVQFALEIMRLKPSFARKQNQYGFCPLHLALQQGQTHMVLRFLDVDRNLVRVQGREGKTSLHYVAEKGNADLLSEFLAACPESIKDVTIQKETAFHIVAKNNKLKALEVLLGWLQYVGKDKILNSTDDEGNTLLHIAISRGHIQMVRMLLSRVQINNQNAAGLTALDILENQQQMLGKPEFEELKHMLWKAGALKRPSLPVPNIADSLRNRLPWFRKILLFLYRSSLCITNENRSAVLVVAVLIATATFQAVLSPSDLLRRTGTVSSIATNTTLPSNITTIATNATLPSNITTIATNATFTATNFTISRDTENQQFPHTSWYTDIVMSRVFSNVFFFSNAMAFYISMLVIYRHLPYGTAAALVYPLLFCFFLLNAARSISSLVYTFLLLPVAWFMLASMDALLNFRGRGWFSKVLSSVLKHYASFRNEMTTTSKLDGSSSSRSL